MLRKRKMWQQKCEQPCLGCVLRHPQGTFLLMDFLGNAHCSSKLLHYFIILSFKLSLSQPPNGGAQHQEPQKRLDQKKFPDFLFSFPHSQGPLEINVSAARAWLL